MRKFIDRQQEMAVLEKEYQRECGVKSESVVEESEVENRTAFKELVSESLSKKPSPWMSVCNTMP